MSRLSSIRNRFVTRDQRAVRKATFRLRPTLLTLEERTLLSTFPVTNNAVDDVNTAGTLRWAIAQANTATSPSSIEFELGTTPATITLTGRPARTEQYVLPHHDLRRSGSGGGDGQRQQRQPGVPDRQRRHRVDLGPDHQRGQCLLAAAAAACSTTARSL